VEVVARDFEGKCRLRENQIERLLRVVADHRRIVEKAPIGPFAGQNALHLILP
jgi:hypothetical protein